MQVIMMQVLEKTSYRPMATVASTRVQSWGVRSAEGGGVWGGVCPPGIPLPTGEESGGKFFVLWSKNGVFW